MMYSDAFAFCLRGCVHLTACCFCGSIFLSLSHIKHNAIECWPRQVMMPIASYAGQLASGKHFSCLLPDERSPVGWCSAGLQSPYASTAVASGLYADELLRRLQGWVRVHFVHSFGRSGMCFATSIDDEQWTFGDCGLNSYSR